MKAKIFIPLTLLCASALTLATTGCVEEVTPSGVTIDQNQLNASAQSGMATLAAIPSTMIYCNSDNSDRHCDIGYPGMQIIRDRMTGDMTINPNGTNYDQFYFYARGYNDAGYWMPQLILNFYGKLILSINKAAGAFPEGIETEIGMGCRAKALAFRAMTYLDVARWFEYLPCDVTKAESPEGNPVLHLTYPIVTENTTQTQACNNPRATREQMAEFILSDLRYAEEHINKAPDEVNSALFPDLACVYGLYARLYMWLEDYPNAKLYADKAIAQHGGSPLTEAQWTDPKTGFNTPEGNGSWMWATQLTAENRAVTTGICNFVSFLSPEAVYGYSAAGAEFDPDSKFYNRIDNNDFRKLSWAPTSVTLQTKMKFNAISDKNRVGWCNNHKLVAVKFRPNAGEISDYKVASAGANIVMRLEEMYFISIEAQAHTDAAGGKKALVDFMKAYRNPKYTCNKTKVEDVVEEIVFQKRVELWGEGQTLWDIKRLNYSVERGYNNTNWIKAARFNTEGRPAWMNLVFVQTEGNSNEALRGWNNPNTTGLYNEIPDDEVNFDAKKW